MSGGQWFVGTVRPDAKRDISVVGVVHPFAEQNDIGAAGSRNGDIVPAVDVEGAGQVVGAICEQIVTPFCRLPYCSLHAVGLVETFTSSPGDPQGGAIPGEPPWTTLTRKNRNQPKMDADGHRSAAC